MALISFIIPTHNRYQYAVKTISSLLTLSKDIEIVVSDTSDNNLLSEYFDNQEEIPQLKIVRPGEGLSVVDNFNYGLANASGEYLVFLGDDDFVSESVINVALWAKGKSVDSIKFSFPVNYYWPDFKHRSKGDHFSATLSIQEYSGEVQKHDVIRALDEASYDFGRGVLDLPRAYSGMISKKLADQITLKYGALFGGVSPDIYSSTLIAFVSENAYKIDFPVVIPGASGASTSGLSATGKHTGGLRDNPHIGAFKKLVWDERIPEFYSVPTVWSYSFLKALEIIKYDNTKINFSRLYLRCFIYYRSYYPLTLISFRQYIADNNLIHVCRKMSSSLISEFFWVTRTIWGRVKRNKQVDKQISIANLNDVLEAKAALDKYIIENDKSIKW